MAATPLGKKYVSGLAIRRERIDLQSLVQSYRRYVTILNHQEGLTAAESRTLRWVFEPRRMIVVVQRLVSRSYRTCVSGCMQVS